MGKVTETFGEAALTDGSAATASASFVVRVLTAAAPVPGPPSSSGAAPASLAPPDPGGYRYEVWTQIVQLAGYLPLYPGTDRHDHDDRRHPDDDAKRGERRARPVAEQRREAHTRYMQCLPHDPTPIFSCVLSSATTRPSRTSTILSARAATSMSCVTMIRVV